MAATGRSATEMTRQAARFLKEHVVFMEACADAIGPNEDLRRLPETVLRAVEQAHLARQAAVQRLRAAQAAQHTAALVSSEAVAVNREAAQLLVDRCGLPPVEAARFLGLSPQRMQWLLTG